MIGPAESVAEAVVSSAAGQAGVDVVIGGQRWWGDAVVGAGAAASLTPLELLLAGLGSCTALTLQDYAEQKGWPLDGVQVELGYWVDDEGRAIVTRDLHLEGELEIEQQARLRALADRTPITKALRGGTEITTHLR